MKKGWDGERGRRKGSGGQGRRPRSPDGIKGDARESWRFALNAASGGGAGAGRALGGRWAGAGRGLGARVIRPFGDQMG